MKRSLSVRDATQARFTHQGITKTYKVDRSQFDRLTEHLVKRCETRVTELVRGHSRGWGEIDAVLLTGGSTRIPAVRAMLKRLAGTTPLTELSPDQSVAHGACLYAGLLADDETFAKNLLGDRPDDGDWRDRLSRAVPKPRTGRGLGILVRDDAAGRRVPHYLIPPNSELPAEATQTFGTVTAGQGRVRLKVVQAGPTPDAPPTLLGECLVAPLPQDLPENSLVDVTLSLDASGLVHARAVERSTGLSAEARLVRPDGEAPAAPPPLDPTANDEHGGEEEAITPEPAKPPSAAPPPAPSRTGTEAEEGESEFWDMVSVPDPPAPTAKPKRRRAARRR